MGNQLARIRGYAFLLGVAAYLGLAEQLALSPAASFVRPVALFLLAVSMTGVQLRVRRLRGVMAVPNLLICGAVLSVGPLLGTLMGTALAAIRHRVEGSGWSDSRQTFARTAGSGAIAFIISASVRVLDWNMANWGLAFAATCLFLFLQQLLEAALGRLPYWQRAVERGLASTAAMAIIFGPASLLMTQLFDVAQRVHVWPAVAAAVIAYLVLDWKAGPLYEDTNRADEMNSVYLRSVEALALAVDAKDRVSSDHLKRVQGYCVELGRALNCTEKEMRTLEFGALLHDIGKIAVPENLLTKPGKLSPEEFKQVASHAQIGAEILAAVDFPFPVAELVLAHHENWDGTGYPNRLRGEQIPLTARILSAVDTFDALTSDRPYRAALSTDSAVEFLRSRSGKSFDPEVVEALIEFLPHMEERLQRDLEASRRQRVQLSSPRSIQVEQTSLTAAERIESLKQNRPLAVQDYEVEDSSWRRVLSALTSSLSVEESLDIALPAIRERIPFDESALFLKEDGQLRLVYCSGPKADDLLDLRVPVGDSPTGWVAGHGETLINGNPVGEVADFGTTAWTLGLKAALVTPLWSDGHAVGTLNLYSREHGFYTAEHAAELEFVAGPLGRLLVQASVYDSEPRAVDPLTDLPEARATIAQLRTEVARLQGSNKALSLLFLDVDHFGAVNARYGHRTGDRILVSLANALRDLNGLDFVGRLGEDRFLCICRGVTPMRVPAIMRRVRHVVQPKTTLPNGRTPLPAGITIGYASFPYHGKLAETLLLAAADDTYRRRKARGLAAQTLIQSPPRIAAGSEQVGPVEAVSSLTA